MPAKGQITVQAENTSAATRHSFSDTCQMAGAVRRARYSEEDGTSTGDGAEPGGGTRCGRAEKRESNIGRGKCKIKVREAG